MNHISGESLVLSGSVPGNLCFDKIVKGSVTVSSSYLPGGMEFQEDQDYHVDYGAGTIIRSTNSRIPDYSQHRLYGVQSFNHTQYPKEQYFNDKWFVWVSYQTRNDFSFADANDQSQYLEKTREKLTTGGPFKVITYGDSITAGSDIADKELSFTHMYVNYLRQKFPKAEITCQDISIPGYSSKEGLDWFTKKPESQNATPAMGEIDSPDLVMLGFGMNDHNNNGNSPEEYKNNLVEMARLIKTNKGADVILYSAFPPNKYWLYSSNQMEKFAVAAQQAAGEAKCAYVDVFSVWDKVLKRKDQSSLLANNINHPNYFGHWLYEQAFEAMKF